MTTEPILFQGRGPLYQPGKSLTRMDKDGIPAIVQRIDFDHQWKVFRCTFFDGSICVFANADKRDPTPEDWAIAEVEGRARYYQACVARHTLIYSPI